VTSDEARLQQLERRIEALARRVEELERELARARQGQLQINRGS
jgi:prefoldin subunit 5